MGKKFKLTKQLPEPFNTALQLDKFSFDYHLMPNQDDHKWLKEHGYTLEMGFDCAYYVSGLDGLNATSYGNWGTAYHDENDHSDNEGFNLFCEMYNEGIIIPWRIMFDNDYDLYIYNHETKQWSANYDDGTYDWVDCENPLPKILSEINQNDK